MDFLNFVTAIHHRLGVDIPELDYPKLVTLEGAVRYLQAEACTKQALTQTSASRVEHSRNALCDATLNRDGARAESSGHQLLEPCEQRIHVPSTLYGARLARAAPSTPNARTSGWAQW